MASKRTKTSVEKVLAAAIEAETVELRAELARKDQRIAHLERTIKAAGEMMQRAIDAQGAVVLPAPTMPPQLAAMLAGGAQPEQEGEEFGPGPELAGEDDMGAGRWV